MLLLSWDRNRHASRWPGRQGFQPKLELRHSDTTEDSPATVGGATSAANNF